MIEAKQTFSFSGLLSQSIFPDLSLTTADGEGRHVPAHRVVLAAVSSKLSVMCQEGGRVLVRNISFKVLELVVRFVYAGKVILNSMEEVEDLRDGIDLLRINIRIELDKLCDNQVEEMEKVKSDLEDKKDSLDKNANIGVKTSFSCLEDLWSDNKDNSAVSDLSSSSYIQTTFNDNAEYKINNDQLKVSHFKTKDLVFNCIHMDAKSPSSKWEIHNQTVECEYCGESVKYRCYVRHCKKDHPSSLWRSSRRKCGTCNCNIPEVIFDHHLLLFGHKEKVKENYLYQASEIYVAGKNVETPSKKQKQSTKIPCDYCGEQVPLMNYVSHCKKLHSISDSNEICRKKCYKCGAKVHVIAEKFHDEIYHPVQPKHVAVKHEPLEIEDKKNMTKVRCDYCHFKVVFCAYKSHVRRNHPEIAYAELVKCGKCGSKVAQILFKFHSIIYHNSNKIKAHPISYEAAFKQVPKVPCSQCDAKVKPLFMFLHLKTVHDVGKAEESDGYQDITDVDGIKSKINNLTSEVSEVEGLSDDEQNNEGENVKHVSGPEIVLSENPVISKF